MNRKNISRRHDGLESNERGDNSFGRPCIYPWQEPTSRQSDDQSGSQMNDRSSISADSAMVRQILLVVRLKETESNSLIPLYLFQISDSFFEDTCYCGQCNTMNLTLEAPEVSDPTTPD